MLQSSTETCLADCFVFSCFLEVLKISIFAFEFFWHSVHIIYPDNNMCQKCGGKTGFWVLKLVEISGLKSRLLTPSILAIICVKNVGAKLVCGFFISTQIGLHWLCYLVGNSQTAPTIFLIFSAYVLFNISWRTHKPLLPPHFWHILLPG